MDMRQPKDIEVGRGPADDMAFHLLGQVLHLCVEPVLGQMDPRNKILNDHLSLHDRPSRRNRGNSVAGRSAHYTTRRAPREPLG